MVKYTHTTFTSLSKTFFNYPFEKYWVHGLAQADNSDNIKDNSNYENKGKPLILLFTSDISEVKKGKLALSSFDQKATNRSKVLNVPGFHHVGQIPS